MGSYFTSYSTNRHSPRHACIKGELWLIGAPLHEQGVGRGFKAITYSQPLFTAKIIELLYLQVNTNPQKYVGFLRIFFFNLKIYVNYSLKCVVFVVF